MDSKCITLIIICCYVIGEMYKYVFKNYKNKYKLIPFINAILGGLLGLLIYIMTPEYIYVNNPYEIIIIGIMSGTSSTGTNQIIKQVFKKRR